MPITIDVLKEKKERGEKFAVLTAYDYPLAKLLDEAGVPVILVGDSLGMVVLGYDSTIPVTMDDMLHHIKAVARGAKNALIVGDLPFMAYQASQEDALRNAARFMQEGGTHAVKLEGGERMAPTVRRLVECGIPVMGHIGLTPQSVHQLGGYKVQGKTAAKAAQLLKDAQALEEAGAFSIVLESVPATLAKLITKRVKVPTIGIGAGLDCDAQVQVINDILGLYTDLVPKHTKQYARLSEIIRSAVATYLAEVKTGAFPTVQHSYSMDESILGELLASR
jgi:3-methyl-2-oxobutanoate hydroxymethyltransferase